MSLFKFAVLATALAWASPSQALDSWWKSVSGWKDFSISGGVHVTTAGVASATCGLIAAPTGPVGVIALGAGCAALAHEGTARIRPWLSQKVLGRDLDPDAASWGGFAGSVVGGALGAGSALGAVESVPGDYATYERLTRSLTEKTIRRLPWRSWLESARRARLHVPRQDLPDSLS